MRRLAVSFAVMFILALTAGACGGGSKDTVEESASQKEVSATAGSGKERDLNACHLLGHDEVSALAGKTVVMRDETEATERYSTCEYSDESDQFVFGMTVYWSGGKQEWETWRMATGLASSAFERQEQVELDAVVEQGPVSGLGDAAYFSELLPSLVLQGDTLIELNLALIPEAGKKFRGLAETLLSRL